MVFEGYPMNYWAVLVSGIVAMMIGFFWYSEALFGKQWMKLTGIKPSKKDNEGMAKKMILTFAGELVLAFVLLGIIKWAAITTVTGALFVGFLTWLGFIATLTMGEILWQNKSWKLYALNNGQHLLKFIVVSIILTLWA